MNNASLFLLGLLVAVMLGYGLFEARRLLEGPRVVIDSPRDGSATSTGALRVTGRAENISFLTLNDRPSFTDEGGNFQELLSLPSGYTVVTVAAIDRFGRRVKSSVSITVLNYCPLHA